MRSMLPYRLSSLIKMAIPSSLQRSLSSSSISRARISDSYFDDDPEGGSAVYRHALKFQRPTEIKWKQHLHNSASFIGTVVFSPRVNTTKKGSFGAYTALNVATSFQSTITSKIVLQMWDDLAKISLQHLKRNDFIYVSGFLGSYEKVDANRMLRTAYKVYVRELNYVAGAPSSQGLSSQNYYGKSVSQGASGIGGLEENKENHVHLWQLFFANPYEWWDNRKDKPNPRNPDFKHKDTGEALWLCPEDPPWIRKQLQLLDSRNAADQGAPVSSHRRVSTWEYDE